MHLGTQKFHTINVQRLTLNVLSTHKHVTFKTESGADSSSRNAMLPCTGFSNYPLFPQKTGQQSLANRVVNLVRTRMVKIFPLEPDLGSSGFTGKPLSKVQWAGATNVIRKILVEFGLEVRILLQPKVFLFQGHQGVHQSLGNESSSEGTKMTPRIRQCSQHFFSQCYRHGEPL